MSISKRFVLEHGAPIRGLLGLVAASAAAPLRGQGAGGEELRASRRFEKTVEPPSRELVRTYVRAMGGEPSHYRGLVPPHLFPQWTFDLAAKTLMHLPLSFVDLVNNGCRLEARAPLPRTCDLQVSGELVDVRRDGRRLRFDQKFTTGPSADPEALVAHMYTVLVRGGSGESESGSSPQRPVVPDDSRQVRRWSLPADAGWQFSMLTGDFNPLHWFGPAARMVGFDAPILHGFATMARAWEALARDFGAATSLLGTFDVRFTRPLVLPGETALYVESGEGPIRSGEMTVGPNPGEQAHMVGEYEMQRVSEVERDDE